MSPPIELHLRMGLSRVTASLLRDRRSFFGL
jgi:hypothetical protein